MGIRLVLLLAVVLSGQASAYVRAYAIDPVKAQWSGKVSGNPLDGYVSQVVTCCWEGPGPDAPDLGAPCAAAVRD